MSEFQGKKIKIISSDSKQNWYNDKIGETFIVNSLCSRNKDNLIVRTKIEQSGWKYGWVSKKDCVFVN
ncbi:hypothetical protein CG478_013695 [Bacillus cytotoxicus]|nr:hypothetical protein CG483_013695 [Bacillus cytotoxicus]AWC41400.1 hypothetical protein CG480_013695 [Bacillus cytotoxicus]AWC49331.1 hypothetical protein CG478_013695 [Bacillus cytotoxicus]AWC53346.1 hypothetical protein CG477_013655 [Bacillus cytotoxicus]AWC57473.1 hypothetical protein CG476_013680 [Bacillus cytotoxicus]